jgi:hypothetical protein
MNSMHSGFNNLRSRRTFLRSAILTAGSAALARGSHSFAQTSVQGVQVPRRFIIDAHQHFTTAPDYVDRLVRYTVAPASRSSRRPPSGHSIWPPERG